MVAPISLEFPISWLVFRTKRCCDKGKLISCVGVSVAELVNTPRLSSALPADLVNTSQC